MVMMMIPVLKLQEELKIQHGGILAAEWQLIFQSMFSLEKHIHLSAMLNVIHLQPL